MDIPSLAVLLRETAQHHDTYEKVAPDHDWWDWYAAYLHSRQLGTSPEEASAIAGRYLVEARHVDVPDT